ncbi:MAG: hypothetical protein AB1768_05865 [Pseudomonadota bacterium]|jgi:hypothetical protein
MLWPGRPRSTDTVERDFIAPATLPVTLDEALFERHLQTLEQAAARDGGVEAYLDSLSAKQRLFAAALAPEALARFDLEAAEVLLETVFSARRRLYPLLEAMEERLPEVLEDLLYGTGALAARMTAFVEALPYPAAPARKVAAKLRRAAWDFAAECLHFRDPARYPLLARWVWDAQTMSGALREFVAGAASDARLPLDNRPETIEGARAWLAERIERRGIYRDVALWVDMVMAAAYSHYFRAMTGGTLGGDFTRGIGPEEEIKKLLGIDPARRSGKSKVVKATEEDKHANS